MSTSDGEGKEEGMQHQQKISQMRGGRRGEGGLSIACVIQYGRPLLLLPPTATTKKLISMRGTSSVASGKMRADDRSQDSEDIR